MEFAVVEEELAPLRVDRPHCAVEYLEHEFLDLFLVLLLEDSQHSGREAFQENVQNRVFTGRFIDLNEAAEYVRELG